MKRLFFVILLLGIFAHTFAKHKDTLAVSQLEFVPNVGQWSGDFLFRAAIHSGALFFDKDGYIVSLLDAKGLHDIHSTKTDCLSHTDFKVNAASYKVSFLNCNSHSSFTSDGVKSTHYYNFYNTKNHEKWKSGIFSSSKLVRKDLYEGVDLYVFQSENNLKYEFHISPGSDPAQIRMRYDGVRTLSMVSNCLWVDNYISRIVEMEPFAYQLSKELDTIPVDCHYVLRNSVVSFSVGEHDPSLPLIIDPVVVFSSFSGSAADNWGYTATYDSHGNLYGGGIAFGVGYPTTLGAYQVDFCNGSGSGLTDISISKFDSTGTFLHYSTYLGGSFVDIPHSLHVNDNDELYLFGTTGSPDFPVTANAFDTSFNYGSDVSLSTSLRFTQGSDIFVSKFSEDGTQLLASTFVGGSSNDGINTSSGLRKNYADDNRGEILIDKNSNVYVVTSTFSTDFPVTANAFETVNSGGQDVCVFKMSQDLSQMVWCSYLGGSGNDAGYSMMLSDDESVYLCGGTSSVDFPVSPDAFQMANAGEIDGFVAHISSNGHWLLNSTYLGETGYDQAYLIKADRDFFPHVFGQTDAHGNTWIHNADYYVPNAGQFLLKFSTSLDTVLWSTAFGTGNGGPDISPSALSVDMCGNVYMSGWGSTALNGFGGTSGLPITSDAFQSTTDGSDYYFICLTDNASNLVYGSYFGGAASGAREHVDGGTSRFDKKGRIYQAVCAGCTGQSSFPTTPNAWSTTNGSQNCNLGVIKMDFGMPVIVSDFRLPSVICAPASVHFENFSQIIGQGTSYTWDFGDGTYSSETNPTHYYANSGYYPVTLIVQDNGSCNFSDTLTKYLLVLANSTDTLTTKALCLGDYVQIGLPPSNDVSYVWSPASTLSNPTISNPIATPVQTTWYMLLASTQGCSDTIFQKVEVSELNVTFPSDTIICKGDAVTLSTTITTPFNNVLWSTASDFSTLLASNQLSVTVQPEETTTYFVRVTHDACVMEEQIVVVVSEVEIDSLPNLLICFDDGVDLSVSHNAGADCLYQWAIDDVVVSQEEHPFVSLSASCLYSVTVTNIYGCSAIATGMITKRHGTFPDPLEAWCDVCEITQAETTEVFATDYGTDYHYQWTPVEDMETPNNPSSAVSPLENTIYTVVVTDTFGCVKSDTVQIIVHELTCDDPFIFIPNAFSPNGDGINDILYVRSAILDSFYFAIYSRWGEKVFETTRLEDGWNGTFKQKMCQNGVYDYYFKGTCIGGKQCELKGNVMLVR